jgi:outer membrane protein assembly factor BamB
VNIARKRAQGLTFYNPAKTYDGYTLFTPMHHPGQTGQVWLVDMQGEIIHCWKMAHAPGPYGLLLPNGNLLYAGKTPNDMSPGFGGSGGELVEVDWDGNVVWKYEDPFMHHDFYRMPNGNTMTLRWVKTPIEIAAKVKGGLPNSEKEGIMWADSLQEVTPKGKVVWKWLAYEHIDFEADVMCPICDRSELSHCNSCQVLPDGNILISMFKQNAIAIIDKKTGNYKWRWGPPGELGHQHNPSMLENGHILVFDNGMHRIMSPGKNFILLSSRVLEIDPKTRMIVWEYCDEAKLNFWGPFISGCQRLPNGNTLICEGPFGRIFEVNSEKELVWEYVAPFYSPHPSNLGWNNAIFRAYRYGPDYPGLKGRDLTPGRFEWVIQEKVISPVSEKVMEERLGRLGY